MPIHSNAAWTVDTGILICATALDAAPARQRSAQALLQRLFESDSGCLAGQVLAEYLSVVGRRRTMGPALALDNVQVWSRAARMLDTPASAYDRAWRLSAQQHYPVWDALLIAICAEHGVGTVYTESTGPLAKPLGVSLINPFQSAP